MIKNRDFRVAILLSLIIISSCSRSVVIPEVTDPYIATLITTDLPNQAMSTPDQLILAPATPAPEIPRRTEYTFLAEVDYNKHTLQVTESILFQNQTGAPLTVLKLVVPPNREPGVFELKKITISDVKELKNQTLVGVEWMLELVEPLTIGEVVTIQVEYFLKLPKNGVVLGYSAHQMNISDWYPFVPPYDSQIGWVVHPPAEVGEYLVYEMADFHLTLAGTEGLQVAASTLVVPNIGNVKLAAQNVRNLTFSVSDQYELYTARTEQTTINTYVFTGDEVSGQAALDNTRLAVVYFSELFGSPYAHESMTLVEADFDDGMEYDGLYYLSRDYFARYDGGMTNYLSLLAVHETAHQWWYAQVANDQALEPWLDEALATYSEYLYIERYYPELSNWWWEYRVDTYKPSGRANLTIYDQDELRPYINSVYLQGASFLHELRSLQGDVTFFLGLRAYAKNFNSQIADEDGFLDFMIPVPTEETKVLMQKYFGE